MSAGFVLVQGERLIEAFYAEPAFDLLRDSTRLFRLIHARFATDGLASGDMRIVSGEGSLGEAHLQYAIRSARTLVRVYVSKVAITTMLGAGAPDLPAIATSALGVVAEADDEIEYDQYAGALTAHGTLQGDTAEFLSSFVTKVPKLGQLRSAGCVFYFGPEGDTLSSSVTLDSSVVVEDGLFLATRATFDGRQVRPESVIERFRSYTYTALDSVGLRLDGEQGTC